ncbi:MAG: universal stress protein UspE [Mucilaginibacter sp.]|jgi:nucleotide-binding universal stress UspA family protein|nr:universal stress protein UspE [Mucilaginibacter sp.]
MKTILVLTDFSFGANNAAHYALKLAQKIRANLLLCNVFLLPSNEPLGGQVLWSTESYDTLAERSKNGLNKLAGHLKRQMNNDVAGGEFRPAIKQSSVSGVFTALLDEIVSSHEILITVVGTHGTSGLSGFLQGNHVQNLIEKANCPVLIVPSRIVFNGYKKIVFATDMTGSDIDVLHSLSGFARYVNAEILVTHVFENKTNAKESTKAEVFLKMISSKINYPRIFYREIKSESVSTSIDWLSEHIDVDLLVVVHRKRNFFQILFEASVTQKLADHLTKAMLVFPFTRGQHALPVF